MKNAYEFDYSKLLGKIKEKKYTNERFAKALGIGVDTFSGRINNKSEFKQCEMIKACILLDIPLSKLHLYFFCHGTL